MAHRRTTIHRTSGNLDELYCEFFKCEKCEYEWIIEEDKYCGGCGKKIIWV